MDTFLILLPRSTILSLSSDLMTMAATGNVRLFRPKALCLVFGYAWLVTTFALHRGTLSRS